MYTQTKNVVVDIDLIMCLFLSTWLVGFFLTCSIGLSKQLMFARDV